MDNPITFTTPPFFKALAAILCLSYFILQPWDIHAADILWLLLALFSIILISTIKVKGQNLDAPPTLQQLLVSCAAIASIAILSFIFTPLDNLKVSSLEPYSRFLLIIPIILAMRFLQIGPLWILTFLGAYSTSTFISAASETNLFSILSTRANGDENAVPYGMFNSTVTGLLLVFANSQYLDSLKLKKYIKNTIKTGALILALMSAIAAIASGTRAALILLPIIIFTALLLELRSKKALTLSTLSLIVICLFLALKPTSIINQKMAVAFENTRNYFTINDTRSKLTSTGQRLEQWRESTCIFVKHPILGTGPRTYRQAHQKYGGKKHCNATQGPYEQVGGSFQAHSLYFNTLSTNGILGILSLLIFFILSIKASRQENPTTITKLGANLFAISTMCLIINGLTLDLWFRNHVANKHILIWALPLLLIFPYNKKTQNIDNNI